MLPLAGILRIALVPGPLRGALGILIELLALLWLAAVVVAIFAPNPKPSERKTRKGRIVLLCKLVDVLTP